MNRFDRERWDTMGKEALSRVEELMNTSRINDLIHKREEDEKKKNCILWVLAIIGAVAAVAGIAPIIASTQQYTVSLLRIIWKILKMTSMTTSMMISLRMRKQKRRKAKRKKRGLRKRLNN